MPTGPEKCPIHLYLLWIGEVSLGFFKANFSWQKKLLSFHQSTYCFWSSNYIDTNPEGSIILVLQFTNSDADYVGRTGQRLEAAINQHVPANICRWKVDNLHRCVNIAGLQSYSPQIFSELSKADTDCRIWNHIH